MTEAERSADYTPELRIELAHGSPLDVRDLHVSMDKANSSVRNASFVLVNRSSQKVTAFGWALGRVDDGCFSISKASPANIAPGGTSELQKIDYSAYRYWCDGATDHRLVVDHVRFADGSMWRDSKAYDRKPRPACTL